MSSKNSSTAAQGGKDAAHVLSAAIAAAKAGRSVIPVNSRTKRPFGEWEQYQTQRNTPENLEKSLNLRSFAVITGQISATPGNYLVCLDFDVPRFFFAWRDAVGTLADGLPVQKTGGGGYQVFFECPLEIHNTKLAYAPNDTEETGREIAIETRGEGGYAVIAPSLHPSGQYYEWISRDLNSSLKPIPKAQAEALMAAARELDEAPWTRQQQEAQAKRAAEQATKDANRKQPVGGSVIDAYNVAHEIGETLSRYGYKESPRNPGRRIRPGGNHDSVTVNREEGWSFHHNSNDPLNTGHTCKPFDVFCIWEHGGDVKAAVRAAAAELNMTYTPRQKVRFVTNDPNAEYASTSGGSTQLEDDEGVIITTGLPLTDTGNAERFISQHGRKILYCPGIGWFIWNGCYWQEDKLDEIHRLGKKTVRNIYAEAQATDDDKRPQIAKWAVNSESKPRRMAMIDLAQLDGPKASSQELDKNPWVLTVKNGVLDLKTGQLCEPRQEDLITCAAPVTYDPLATCPCWKKFLWDIFAGDEDVILFIQRFIGYCLTGITSEQAFVVLHGKGANGKSTLLNVLRALLGSYCRQTKADTLMQKRQEGMGNDVAILRGARMVTAVETNEGRKLDEGKIKEMTGDDIVTCRFMYKEFFEYKPEYKIWLATNHKPQITGTDDGIWRRVRLIPFNVQFWNPDKGETGPGYLKADKTLAGKLEQELPGILNWALEGCLSWQENGLPAPKAVQDATATYRHEQDPIETFLSDCCTRDTKHMVQKGQLHREYQRWAQENDEPDLTSKAFSLKISEKGFEDKRGTGGVRFWLGIGLLERGSI